MSIDQDKLGQLLGTFVTDLGAALAAGSVVVGHRLGLYRGLAEAPASAEQLARRTSTDPRYVTEWLRGQAAGGYVSYDQATEQFSLTEEQAFALADPEGPLYLPEKTGAVVTRPAGATQNPPGAQPGTQQPAGTHATTPPATPTALRSDETTMGQAYQSADQKNSPDRAGLARDGLTLHGFAAPPTL